MKIRVAHFKASSTDFSVILLASNSELTAEAMKSVGSKLPKIIQRPIVIAAKPTSDLAFYGQDDLVNLIDEVKMAQFPWKVLNI
jgi:hypothetical protein